MKYVIPAIAALALAGPAIAGNQSEAKPVAAAADESSDNSQNRMVCKRQKDTGSRLGSKKICMTAAQWAQLKRDQREATERSQAARYKND